MLRCLIAILFIVCGGRILDLATSGREPNLLAYMPFEWHWMAYGGGFFLLYGLRIAVKGWPDMQKFFQLFILGPIIVIGCELIAVAGIMLINQVDLGFAPLNGLVATIGVVLFVGGIAFAVFKGWNERQYVTSIY